MDAIQLVGYSDDQIEAQISGHFLFRAFSLSCFRDQLLVTGY